MTALSVGDHASLTMALTAQSVEAFADVTGDANPVHLDDAFAATTRFGRRIGHGMWAGSLISSVLGTRLPGPGTIYLSQTLQFVAPIYIGDQVTARVEVTAIRADRPFVTLATMCKNEHGELLVSGEAVVLFEPAPGDQPG